MNLNNITKEAKLDLFKKLVQDLEADSFEDTAPQFELRAIGDYVDQANDRLNNPDRLDGISTGYPKLDVMTSGLVPGELIVVAGATHHGKTQFAQAVMLNMVLENNPVLFFTLEMLPVETTIRFLKMAESKGGKESVPHYPLYYYEGKDVNLAILDSAIKKGIEKGIKCVFIDHLHFFARKTDNASAEVGQIVRSVKLLARKYEIPIVLVSHIRKINNVSAMPELDDLRDSSFIGQDADMVLMVWREMNPASEKEGRYMKVSIKKNRRRGIMGKLLYYQNDNYYLEEQHEDRLSSEF